MRDFINQSALKKYINSLKKTRVNKKAFNNLTKKINSVTQTIIKESRALAQKDKRTTIMPRDIVESIEKTIGKKHLTWQELVQEITRLGPIEIGNISKAIDNYIEKQKNE